MTARPALRLIVTRRPVLVTVPESALDELRTELVAARAERTVLAARLRTHVRAALRYLTAGATGGASMELVEMARLVEQEALRASRMEVPACPCGHEGPGHGMADAEAVAA